MAGNLSNYGEGLCTAWLFSTDAATRPTAWYVALYTSSPDDTGGGVEVSGGGYARQAVTFTNAGGGIYANTALLNFTAAGADFGTIVAAAIVDAPSAGNLLAWNLVPSQSVVNGQSATFAAGQLTVRFD